MEKVAANYSVFFLVELRALALAVLAVQVLPRGAFLANLGSASLFVTVACSGPALTATTQRNTAAALGKPS